MEATTRVFIEGLGSRVLGLGWRVQMENQMEKNMENETDTRVTRDM